MKRLLLPILALLTASCVSQEGQTPLDHKAVVIIIDGVPTDVITRLQVPSIFDIASEGAFGLSYVGGEVGSYSQTPTISAVGYQTMLTGTWANKHNVWGNDNLSPAYSYKSMFQIAKEQPEPLTTALFSSWTDNRTVLLGEGKPETGNLRIDYVCDGYDLDHERFPNREYDLQVFDYDEEASTRAAECIRENAPDLSWVYLWYTDDAGHIAGNGEYLDEYTLKAGEQIDRVWQAVKYRQENFGEDWMIIVTTDHGRTLDGHDHGGQSARERGGWIAVNQSVGERFLNGGAAMVDINPTVCRFLGLEVPLEVRLEQDGIDFLGKTLISDMQAMPYDGKAVLSWECYEPDTDVNVYAATANEFRTTGHEQWIKLATVKASDKAYTVDLSTLGKSDFYKFALETEHECLNRWLKN